MFKSGLNLFNTQFKEYLSGIEFFRFDPNLILVTTNDQINSIQVYNLETRNVSEALSNNDDAFNLVCSLTNENLVVASTMNGHLKIYEFSGIFKLKHQVSLEVLFNNYKRNKSGN